ncbi:MAG: UbiA family prenyltransferase [Bacteroidia bacterium]|nr:UbiA family prenyltransferase [Bacteroidia bacterium]
MNAPTTVKSFFSLVKFSHTIFAMPFAIIGFFVAVQKFNFNYDVYLFLKVIACMVLARNAAMAYNRYIDASIDAINPRTAVREIPAGVVSPRSALAFVIINCVLFIGVTFSINMLCFALSPVALGVILGYSWSKRFTALCHVILGLGLSLAPIGAFIAVSGQFMLLPILFSVVVLLWVSGFDIIYALQDQEFDVSNNLHSIPARMGKDEALNLAKLLHVFSCLIVLWAGSYGHFHLLYWIGACIFIALVMYQHSLVKADDLSKVNIAFFTTNGIASMVFGTLVVLDLFMY